MSDRKRKELPGGGPIEWLPAVQTTTPILKSPQDRGNATLLSLLFGVLLPAAVILVELSTRMCAEAFFDPLPTMAHVALVAMVPIANLLAIAHLDSSPRPMPKWLPVLSGLAIAVSAFYALIFLPLLPLAVVAVLFYGLGVLPMGPLASFAVALRLRTRLSQRHGANWTARPVWVGAVTGLALLLMLDIPAAATRLGTQWAVSPDQGQRARGLALLRSIGDQQQLLRLCYDSAGRPSGLLSFLVTYGGGSLLDPMERNLAWSTNEMREIFYRTYGVPFNALPPPHQNGQWARFNDFAFDADHGGTEVGGRIKGLDLVSSRIDGSISGDDATAYLEWIFEFRNTSPLDREARVGLALPPGAVVSRATLWVNAEEREAAYGGRGEVRKAYEQVAVRQRQDPLLVTTKGADRVLAQAFPVGRGGGTIKFKIGITAPLDLLSNDRAALTLPAIVDRNFSFPGDAKHAIWLEGKRAMSVTGGAFRSEQVDADRFRLQGSLTDQDLAKRRPQVIVDRDPAVTRLIAKASGGRSIVQEFAARPNAPPAALMIVLDGSQRMGPHARDIAKALDTIPEGSRAGLIIAGDQLTRLPVTAWSPDHSAAVKTAIAGASFAGGQDNTEAIAEAVKDLEREPGAVLLWLHGPQPLQFRATSALLEQVTSRISTFPNLHLYAVEPGPNELLPDAPWAWGAKLVPARGDVSADLAGHLAALYSVGETVSVARRLDATVQDSATGSDHIARLWARDEILSLMSAHGEASRGDAVRIATDQRLVTPVSGAVVLETQKQFADNGLTPVTKGSVPTVPEPHEWAMILIASFALMRMAWRQRQMSGGMA